MNVGRLARKVYENMRREAAAIKIQKYLRQYQCQTAYKQLRTSALALQTGFRAMVAHNQFRFKRQTKGATIIQVLHFFRNE